MNVLPVIVRELRAESRSPFTYWLRALGAGAVIMAAGFFILLHGFRTEDGGRLFAQLHGALQLAIWVMVPVLTVDCLSRERREGTLGLLFLTPLKALDIVIAKSLAHGLRAVTLLLAVLPVVALPLLMGGVSWKQAVSSLLLNGSALCLALAAGLLASALSKSWVRSLILAFGLALMFAYMFCAELAWSFSMTSTTYRTYLLNGSDGGLLKTGFQLALSLDPDFFISYAYAQAGFAAPSGMSPGAMANGVLVTVTISLVLSLIALLVVALMAAVITKRNWQERPPSPFAIWLKNKLCTPVVMLDLLQRWMKRKLDRNPIGWLEQRTWSGRLVIWGWFAVMISVYSLVLTNPNFLTRSFNGIHQFMAWILFLSMSVNASTSFRRERETGVLELLLVSPLSETQIILGRLRGLWEQFFPSVALLLGGWIYLACILDRTRSGEFPVAAIVFSITSFIAVPVIGIYYSLICRNFLTSLVTTVLVALILPSILGSTLVLIVQFIFAPSPPATILAAVIGLFFAPYLVQLIIATSRWVCLRDRLVNRRFATEST